MKIKYKTLIIAAFSAVLVIVLTYLMFHIAYFGYINTNQEQQIKSSFEVIDHMLNKEKDTLKRTVLDWAHWDDTYRFIQDSNKDYIASNLEYNSLSVLDIKMMIFLDTKGNTIYSRTFGLEEDIVNNLYKKLLSHKETLKKMISYEDVYDVKSGILLAGSKPFLVAISPVTTSNQSSPSNGSLIMIRQIDEDLLAYIRDVTGVTLYFDEYTIKNFKLYEKLNSLSATIRNYQYNSFLESTHSIKDVTGDSNIVLSVMRENNNYQEVFYYFKLFFTGFLLIILFISFINLFIIYKYILNRLLMLNNFMNAIATTKDTSRSLAMPGKDEFHTLANATNKMLSQLHSAYKDIKEMSERFKGMMEATHDGYLELDIQKRELYISLEWKAMMRYISKDGYSLYNEYISRTYPECFEHATNIYHSVINGHSDYFQHEYRVINASGEMIWVLERGKVVQKDEAGRPTRCVSTLTNITDRKIHEEEILFLSYSDKLTGLKNRAYMEEQFDELDRNKALHYFIIMGDLNGLKLTNDAFGHKEGDRLLYIVGTILQETCAHDDIISRWGGDEFVLLVRNKDKNYIADLIVKIKASCEKAVDFHFKISIALGYAEKNEEDLDTAAIMSLAENRMYRNKLIENKSSRNATISSLSRTLHEKHSETEEHTMRIKNLSLRLGKRLNLSQDKLDELELIALLHDIGKIAIPDHILMKPGALTDEEWQIMKTHTEIGCRIAKSTPELSHISYEILAHHEKFDGTGYPSHLSGKEIPLLSRIINVVDSFDVMTHKRAYKEALSLDYALQELKRYSGTQFDPSIVDEFIKLLDVDNIAESE